MATQVFFSLSSKKGQGGGVWGGAISFKHAREGTNKKFIPIICISLQYIYVVVLPKVSPLYMYLTTDLFVHISHTA